MAQFINVNIGKHGSDPNKVYITIRVDDAEYTVNGERVFVHIGRTVEPDKVTLSDANNVVKNDP